MWRFLTILAVLTSLFAIPARAGDPTGEWRVEDGDAYIRMVICDGRLWGVISWEKNPGIDAKNPNPALRGRPTLGLPIVLGMTPVKPDRWQGSIYNAQDGKTYQATVTLESPDQMEVEGCVLSGWLCSSEDWTRVNRPPALVGAAPDTDLCLRLGVGPGRPHQGGLKQ